MIHGSKRNKTLITGILLLPKIKQKHLDWTNGRFWWFITTHLKSMQGTFWDIVQLQGWFRSFSLETNSGRFFFYSTHDEHNASMHCAWDMGKKRFFFCFQDVTRDFDPVRRYDLEVLCWELQEAFIISLGRRGIACWWGAVYWECQSRT